MLITELFLHGPMQAVFWTGLLGSLLLASSLPSCAGSLMPAVTHTKNPFVRYLALPFFPFSLCFLNTFLTPLRITVTFCYRYSPSSRAFPLSRHCSALNALLLTAMPTLHGLVVLEALTVLSMARSPSDGFTGSSSQNDFPN